MGTNFYWNKPLPEGIPEENIGHHIGKRAAAGPYCYKCGTTLCNRGTSEVHSGYSGWFDNCPSCGAESSRNFSVRGEEPPADHPVKHCCSFTWTLMKHQDLLKRRFVANFLDPALASQDALTLGQLKAEFQALGIDWERPVINEYGVTFTVKEFFEQELDTAKIFFQSPYEFF